MLLVAAGGMATLRADTLLAPVTPASRRASEVHEQIVADHQAVLSMQARARQQQDVIKLTCINDKLIQLKAHMNLADSAVQLLTGSDASTTATATAELNEEAGAIHTLRQEAVGCLGEVELGSDQGASSSHPAFPDDPQVLPFAVYVEPPAYASPFN